MAGLVYLIPLIRFAHLEEGVLERGTVTVCLGVIAVNEVLAFLDGK